jgi:tetratricopeptide (TPR) repeat protein
MADTTPPFKLFFGDEENNVNSFKLGREAGFERFKELLQSLYPRYQPERDTIQYLGADGVKVSFTNEEEYERMLVVCRDRSLVKLYVAGRIDKSEITPVFNYHHYYGYYGYPYWHDWHDWHWGGWGYNRRWYHALQNLWVGHSIVTGLPLWLAGAVTLTDDDYDINVNALMDAMRKHTNECLASKDADSLRQAKNVLATHLMIEQGNTEVLLNLARVDSLLGNYSTAINWLKKAAANGYNDVNRVTADADLKPLHDQHQWDEIVTAIRTNKGPLKKAEPISVPEGTFKFKFGSPDATQEKNKSSSSTAPPPGREQEKPVPAPAPKPASGFLFSLPGAQPEKPKEPEKPAPKPSGFLFSLPGAAAPSENKAPPQSDQKKDEPNPIDAEKAKYAVQLDVLHSMGFLDDSLLIGFLEKFKGNVDEVLTELLG